MSVCEAEHCMDMEMFLDEYPWWEVGGPHCPIILQGISTSMGWDKKMGAVYVSTMTTSMQIMNLEAPSMAVGHQGSTVEELAKEDLAEGHP